MDEKRAHKCVIDDDPLADDINRWLRAGVTQVSVNEHLKAANPEHKGYSVSMISRHRRLCLGMAKMATGRVQRPHLAQTAKDVKKAENVGNDEILRLSKAAFYDRLKNRPSEVSTKELVSVIGALSKGGEDGGEMDALTQAMGDLSDDSAPPASA